MTLARFLRAGVAVFGTLAIASRGNTADLYQNADGMKDGPLPVYAVPVPMWTGFYFGSHLGAEWASQVSGRNVWNDGFSFSPGFPDTRPAFGGSSMNATGAFAGGQLGYNWQDSNLVLGIEADLGGVGNQDDRTYDLIAREGVSGNGLWVDRTASVQLKTESGFYGDVTGRVGYAFGTALLYAKGGYAWRETTLRATANIVDTFPAGFSSVSAERATTLNGWTVGGGIEYLLNPNWTIKVEYLHFDYDDAGFAWTLDANNTWRLTGSNLNIDTAKIGFNYLLK